MGTLEFSLLGLRNGEHFNNQLRSQIRFGFDSLRDSKISVSVNDCACPQMTVFRGENVALFTGLVNRASRFCGSPKEGILVKQKVTGSSLL